jgi:hypothetical protein
MNDKALQNDELELKVALGAPKYYIDTPALKEGETYAWFPTSGDSMTDHTSKSIPTRSLVLGRRLKLNSVSDIPLHCPIVVIIDDNGTQYCMLKSGCAIQKDDTPKGGSDSEMFCLRSYNPAPRCDDFWMPFSHIKYVFVVERVRLPDGNEFIPKQEKVIRERSGY